MKNLWQIARDHFRRMALAYLVFLFTLCFVWAWGDYIARLLEEGTKYLPIPVGGVALALSLIMFGLMWMQINARSIAERLTEDLRRSRERDRLVQMATHDVIREWDLATDEMRWNEAVQSVFGYKRKEVGSRADWWRERLHPDDQGRVLAKLKSTLEGKDEFWSDEYRFRRSNGAYASVIDRGYIVRDPEGTARRMIASNMDITDRKRAEEALADEKERLAVTLGSIADGVITTDVEGRVVLINSVAESLTGWLRADAAGRPFADVVQLIDPATRHRYADPVGQVVRTGTLTGRAEDVVLAGGGGNEKIVSGSGAPIRDSAGRIRGVVVVFRDVTQKHLEAEERLKASKLESLAILANGIAHDLGNIVTAIIGNLSLTKMYSKPADKAFQKLEEAQKAALRAKVLIQQLSTFAKGGALSKSTSMLTELIRDLVTTAVQGLSLRAEFNLPEGIWPVEIDAAQFTVVINNLINQARLAMPEGGVVRVGAENLVLGQPSSLRLPEGKYVRVTLSDQGAGIRPEDVKRIFDPYVVNEDKRSGLGLATAYAIVKKHGGLLTVDSTVGAGTTFYIFLPVSGKEELPAEPVEESEVMPAGKGRILVVDDEESIRMIASELLSELGYEVSLAGAGADALKLYQKAQQTGRPFDLVILDLAMPGGMGGRETIAELQRIDPRVKAIVSSGFVEDPAVVNFEKFGFAGSVTKPYRMEELATVIYELIGHAKF